MSSRQNIRFKLECFNMITVINESKTLIKHISCKCEHKFDSRKCNSNRRWNNEKCEYKTYQTYKKDHS